MIDMLSRKNENIVLEWKPNRIRSQHDKDDVDGKNMRVRAIGV